MTTVSRIVAKKVMSVINESNENLELQEHEVLSFNVMETAITPKLPKVSPRFGINDLGSSKVELVYDDKSTKTIRMTSIEPENKRRPFLGVLSRIDKECRRSLAVPGPKSLVLNSMVTRHIPTDSVCLWRRSAMKDYDGHTVFRLQLRKVDGANADSVNFSRVARLGDEFMEKICKMRKTLDVFKCAYEK